MRLYFLQDGEVCSGRLYMEFEDAVCLKVNGHEKIFPKTKVFFKRYTAEEIAEKKFMPRKKFEDGEKVMDGSAICTVIDSFFQYGDWYYNYVNDSTGSRWNTIEDDLERYHENITVKWREFEVRDTVFLSNNGHLIFGTIIGYEYYEDDWLYKIKSGDKEFEAFDYDISKY